MKRRTRVVAGVLGLVVVAVVGVSTLAGRSSPTATRAAATNPTATNPTATAPTATSGRALTVTSREVTVDGRSRDFTLVSPSRPDGATLLVLPGLGESVAQVRTTSDADSLASSQGVTIAYLGGYLASWNAGTCCGAAQAASLDDETTIRNVIRAVVTQSGLDPHRVFVAGHSDGGFMTLRLACETHGIYAGFLTVSAALVVACPDPGPGAMVFWQGATDNTVPVAGATVGTLTLPPLTTTLAPFTATCGQPVQSAADATTTSYTWTCPGAGTRRLLLSATGGHDWPQPAGQLIGRAWEVFASQRAAAGV